MIIVIPENSPWAVKHPNACQTGLPSLDQTATGHVSTVELDTSKVLDDADKFEIAQWLSSAYGFCAGCGRAEVHKNCPAWGTPYYLSGRLFTVEAEAIYAKDRERAIQRVVHAPPPFD